MSRALIDMSERIEIQTICFTLREFNLIVKWTNKQKPGWSNKIIQELSWVQWLPDFNTLFTWQPFTLKLKAKKTVLRLCLKCFNFVFYIEPGRYLSVKLESIFIELMFFWKVVLFKNSEELLAKNECYGIEIVLPEIVLSTI